MHREEEEEEEDGGRRDCCSSNIDMKIKTSMIPWTCHTNWLVSHGSFHASVTVESSDSPITQSDDPDSTPRKSPVVLMPQGPDSGPCEIKICFEQKYEICQIYVRSTARVYEVYYANSPQSSSEYLCTVRCGVAERDEKLLQATSIEDVAEERGEFVSGELTEETDGHSILTSEDDWVNIKVPEVGSSSLSDKTNINRVENVQDLYEATAQISDADPCSSLTIRLLSLQDKGHVYVDEVYVFVDPIESTGSGNEAVLASNSAQSSLMAMFVPTLLQLSKSSVRQVQDKSTSNEVLKDDNMENGSRKIDEINVGMEINKVDQHYVKSKELDEARADSVEPQQPTSTVNTEKSSERIHVNDLPLGHLERTLEQLISRVSRVEDICLRFEEQMLKPIENMEARLQQVENQLEKLAQNSRASDLPHCTRISAPEFLSSDSNSSSFYNDQSDYPPSGPDLPRNAKFQQVENQLEKLAKNSRDAGLPHCTRISAPEFLSSESNSSSFYNDQSDYSPSGPDLPRDAKFQPSLVVTAPDFSCGEDDEEDNDDLKPLKESPCIKPKKTLSVDDALAAALSGFLSTAKVHPSSKVDEENQHQGHAAYCQNKAQEYPDAENGNMESLQYTQILTVKAPDFPIDGIDEEKHLNYVKSSSDMASANEEKGHDNEMVPPSTQSKSIFTSADSCDLNGFFGNGHLSESSELNTIGSSIDGDIGSDSAADLAKGSVETDDPQIYDKTNPRITISLDNDVKDIETEKVLDRGSESVSDDVPNESESSCASLLDFEFPILEVKFTSDVTSFTKTPLEALLGGAAESNILALSVHDSDDDDGSSEQTNAGNESSDLLPSNDLLVDFGISSADGCSNLLDESHKVFTPSSPELNMSTLVVGFILRFYTLFSSISFLYCLGVSLKDLCGTSNKLSLTRNVLCSKCKGKGSKSFAFGKLKMPKSVKCSGYKQYRPEVSIREPAPCMIHQTQLCYSDCKVTSETISNKDHSLRPQYKLEYVVPGQSKTVEGSTDMQEGMQCAQQ
ncbi:hypothetical protein BUALT_Bualt19G0040000 [Buddleja alternifolia]|uniref:Uncharacterized protein n=1 Tax=Buddleja alternifolia TaxID=168488 RepID=A0AAV6W5D3_9LAMI|nr:hypothetical protein BUALT_Bualt19G0040000 [Buddleja alternifolia]